VLKNIQQKYFIQQYFAFLILTKLIYMYILLNSSLKKIKQKKKTTQNICNFKFIHVFIQTKSSHIQYIYIKQIKNVQVVDNNLKLGYRFYNCTSTFKQITNQFSFSLIN